LCTWEYIDLVKTKFEVELFPVEMNRSFLYRFKKKLGLSAYEDYVVTGYEGRLTEIIAKKKIDYVFLNLSNTITFSAIIKKIAPSVKVILCSHGNESGDFLHEIVLHKKLQGLKEIAARYNLGKMLTKESSFRKYVDVVLTVSEVEAEIEKWLGAEKVYMVPRVIRGNRVVHNPVKGRIGFFGDLSHAPNYYGISKICQALKERNVSEIELRLVSSQEDTARLLEKKFPFLTYLGYLDDELLHKEVASWAFCLNPVFYYSRGVSTKLGKALGMGVPVITSRKGMRGYKWAEGEVLTCETPEQMADLVLKHATHIEDAVFYRDEIGKVQASSPRLGDIMNDVYRLIESNS